MQKWRPVFAIGSPTPTPQAAVLHSCAAPQMDEVTGQLKTNNMKLKGIVTKVRPGPVHPFTTAKLSGML